MMCSTSSPLRLRPEVHREDAVLRDSLTGNRHVLGQIADQVVSVLADSPSREEPVAAVGRLCSISRDRAERELRQLLLLGLLEGSCETFRARVRDARRGALPAPRVLPGSRFACQHSGGCCRGYLFGPISAAEKERIEALGPRERLPALPDKPLFAPIGSGPTPTAYKLATEGEACVFLEPGARCGLHRVFGAAGKPALCRLFPLTVQATIGGLKVYDRGECATFAVSGTQGDSLDDEVPRIIELVDPKLEHPAVLIHGSWRCDYGLILELADRLDAEATADHPLRVLHQLGHVTRGFIAALVQCPLAAGEPEATSAAALRRSVQECRPPEAEVHANATVGLDRLALLARGLAERVAPTEPIAAPFVQATTVLSELCAHLGDGRPLSAAAYAALAISVGDRFDAALTRSLRNQLFGRELLLEERLEPGLLRIALALMITIAGARARAAQAGAVRPTIAQLSLAHMVAVRTLRRPAPQALLRLNGAQVWPILDAVPLLAERLV